MNVQQRLAALQKCGALSSAAEAELLWLAERADTCTYHADQVVFDAGEMSARVFVVAAGALHVRVGESSRLVSYAEPGALIGEYAMFVKGARTAQVVSTEPSTLLSFGDDDFRDFLLRSPTVMLELLQTAVRRLYRAERGR